MWSTTSNAHSAVGGLGLPSTPTMAAAVHGKVSLKHIAPDGNWPSGIGRVDERIGRRHEDIASADDIGATEVNETVAVRMSRGLMYQPHGLAVELDVFASSEIRIGRERCE